MNERIFFNGGKAFSEDLQVVAVEGSETCNFSTEDEWCGSTETGFGATVSVDLDRNEVKELILKLQQWIDS